MHASEWIEQLQMEAHPEGGYFKPSFTSGDVRIHPTHTGQRPLYTSIYFLLRTEDISHFHRLKSDELWYYHAGSALTIHIIDEEGNYRQEKLGVNMAAGEKPQVLVSRGSIFGSTVDQAASFSLVGCMVSPGFDFSDFELFTQDELLKDYPEHNEIINKLAYPKLP